VNMHAELPSRRPASVRALRGLALVCVAAWCAFSSASARAAGHALAQALGEVRVSARLSTGIAKVGQVVELQITVENAQRAQLPELPAIDGLQFGAVPAPAMQEVMSIRAGQRRVERSQTWRIPVRALRPGDFPLPPIALLVDGDILRTPALELSAVNDMRGEEIGWIELSGPPARLAVGQPFELELRFGWDGALSEEINYASLALPWWRGLDGAIERELAPAPRGTRLVEIALKGEQPIAAEELSPQQVRGKAYRAFRVRRAFVATRPGTFELPTSTLEFGVRESLGGFLGNRERTVRSYYVSAAPMSVEVSATPEEGRPLDYGGALGIVRARASADQRDVDAGDSIKLRVEWSGPGNCEFFDVPDPGRLEAFAGFRVFGHTELEKAPDRRTVVYDLAPLSSEVEAIPALPLPVFDPESWTYRTLATEPIPIRVRALRAGATLPLAEGEERYAEDLRDIDARPIEGAAVQREPSAALRLARLGGFGLALGLVWLQLSRSARRRGDPSLPAARARRVALRDFERALKRASDASAELAAVNAFLAARSGERAEAWEGAQVRERVLARAGADARPGLAAAAEALQRAVERLEACIWGGGGGGGNRANERPARTELLDAARALCREGF
jgi:hypothetical protein